MKADDPPPPPKKHDDGGGIFSDDDDFLGGLGIEEKSAAAPAPKQAQKPKQVNIHFNIMP